MEEDEEDEPAIVNSPQHYMAGPRNRRRPNQRQKHYAKG
jgi:hypothetical protein